MKTKTIEVSKEVAKEFWEMSGQILELKQEIESLKCCGNCKHHRVIVNEGKCFEGLPWDEWRFSIKAKPVDADYKCDKWQKL